MRGPRYSLKRGKTPALTAEEARALLDSIRTAQQGDGTETGEPLLLGLRDRALIGTMVYTFARVSAGLRMRVRDYFVQGRPGWVRLHEKGGKEHAVPCHHNLEIYLDSYLTAAGIAEDLDGPLFRTAAGRTGRLTTKPLWQQDAYRMIQRRAKAAGIQTRIGNHTFRATGITAYLKNHGTLETAQQSPTTPPPAPPCSTTEDRKRSRWTKWNGSPFNPVLIPDADGRFGPAHRIVAPIRIERTCHGGPV